MSSIVSHALYDYLLLSVVFAYKKKAAMKINMYEHSLWISFASVHGKFYCLKSLFAGGLNVT